MYNYKLTFLNSTNSLSPQESSITTSSSNPVYPKSKCNLLSLFKTPNYLTNNLAESVEILFLWCENPPKFKLNSVKFFSKRGKC